MSVINLALDLSKRKIVSTVNKKAPDATGNVDVVIEGIATINGKSGDTSAAMKLLSSFAKDSGLGNIINLDIDPTLQKVVQTINGVAPDKTGDIKTIKSESDGHKIVNTLDELEDALEAIPDIVVDKYVVECSATFPNDMLWNVYLPAKGGPGEIVIFTTAGIRISELHATMTGRTQYALEGFTVRTFGFVATNNDSWEPMVTIRKCTSYDGTLSIADFLITNGVNVHISKTCNFNMTTMGNAKRIFYCVNGGKVFSDLTAINSVTLPISGTDTLTSQDGSQTKIVVNEGCFGEITIKGRHTVSGCSYLQVGPTILWPNMTVSPRSE
jgi:hypothetical protein